MTDKKPSRAERELTRDMGIRKTPHGAGGWIPAEADHDLSFDHILRYAQRGESNAEFFADLKKKRRAIAGRKGALSGAVELPDALLPPVLEVIADPPATQQEILRKIRRDISEALGGASGPGVPLFSKWFQDNGNDHAKLTAMLDRSLSGIAVWLETFPSK